MPGKESSNTERARVSKYARVHTLFRLSPSFLSPTPLPLNQADLRMALSDVEHLLRFWDWDYLSPDPLVQAEKPLPKSGIDDVYADSIQALRAEQEYRNICADSS